jgi:tetratricopeptide (TPR) repeat protein
MNAPARGIGHSSPLVTITPAPVLVSVRPLLSSSLSSAVPVTDHPLAVITGDPPASGPATTQFHHPLATPMPPPALLSSTHTTDSPLRTTLSAQQQQLPVKQFVRPDATTSVSPAMTLDDMASAFLSGPSARTEQKGLPPLLYPESLPADGSITDLDRLRLFVDRRAWGDVILMAERLLRGSSSSHYAPIYSSLLNDTAAGLPTLDSQQADLVWIMMVQCQAWVKMRRYLELGLEIERWGFCHHNDNTAPAWIPWSLQIMAANSLVYTTNAATGTNSAVDALWAIRADIPDIEAIAKLQVEHALANAFVRRRDWRMALASLERMFPLLGAACQSKTTTRNGDNDVAAAVALEMAYKCEILSRQGRILLQVGAVQQATQIFASARSAWKPLEPVAATRHSSSNDFFCTAAQIAINEGLISFATEKYDQAFESFREAVQHLEQSSYLTAPSSSASSKPRLLEYRDDCDYDSSLLFPLGRCPAHILYSETINNRALCCLYTCRLQQAVSMMEDLVRQNPTLFLTERIALNLCTLYELSNETSVSARKKRVLQIVAKRFTLHDIGPEIFRL